MLPAIPRGMYMTIEITAKNTIEMIVPLIADATCDGALLNK